MDKVAEVGIQWVHMARHQHTCKQHEQKHMTLYCFGIPPEFRPRNNVMQFDEDSHKQHRSRLQHFSRSSHEHFQKKPIGFHHDKKQNKTLSDKSCGGGTLCKALCDNPET